MSNHRMHAGFLFLSFAIYAGMYTYLPNTTEGLTRDLVMLILVQFILLISICLALFVIISVFRQNHIAGEVYKPMAKFVVSSIALVSMGFGLFFGLIYYFTIFLPFP